MLETSSDLLNIVIAFCVLWLTVFICWFIYYIVSIIKRVADTMEQIAKIANNINDFFSEAKDKIHQATSYMPIIFEGVKKITEYVMVKKEAKKNTSKTQKKTKKAD